MSDNPFESSNFISFLPSEKAIENSAEIIKDFVEGCTTRNLGEFKKHIDSKLIFDHTEKHDFFKYLQSLTKKQGDESKQLTMKKGKCEGCYCGEETYEFYDKEEFYFSFVIKFEGNKPIEIKECYKSTGMN